MYKPHEKDIFGILAEGFKTLASLKKVGSQPKRRERVYKRAAKAQRDLFTERFRAARPFSEKETQRNERAGDFCKKVAASNIQLAATCQAAVKRYIYKRVGVKRL